MVELAAVLQSAGAIYSRSCGAFPIKGGWGLYYSIRKDKKGSPIAGTLKRTRGGPRVFKTLEALVKVAGELGFERVEVLTGYGVSDGND